MRPLHPPLPHDWTSKALRLTMSRADWAQFESLAGMLAPAASTQARAYGMALSALIRTTTLPQSEPSPLEWMDWERSKTLRLVLSRR